MRLRSAVVVITGASSGIGRATARRFAAKGAAVVLAARREEALLELARDCERHGGRALPVSVDVTDEKAVDELARRAVEQYGRIDVWVNNAAVTMFAPVLEMPIEDARRVLDVNLMGYVHGSRAALRQMRAQGSGVLVNVSSVVGVVAQPYTSMYSMSKAAVRSLSSSLRAELMLDGFRSVKACTVLPASVDTPIFAQSANYTGRQAVPMPPVYSPHLVARTIVGLTRLPRREVMAGPAGRVLRLQHALLPGLTERVFAKLVDTSHLSQRRPAPDSSGNLHQPMLGTAEITGGWGGRRRTIQRVLAAAALGAAAAWVTRRVLRRRA